MRSKSHKSASTSAISTANSQKTTAIPRSGGFGSLLERLSSGTVSAPFSDARGPHHKPGARGCQPAAAPAAACCHRRNLRRLSRHASSFVAVSSAAIRALLPAVSSSATIWSPAAMGTPMIAPINPKSAPNARTLASTVNPES
jgi:hypothetical protein